MEYLSAIGIGFFASWLPGVALWLLATFGVPQILIFVSEKIDSKNKHNKLLEKICMWWVTIMLVGPLLVVAYLIFGQK